MSDKVKIEFEIDGIQQGVSSINDLQGALQNTEAQAKKTEKTLEKTAEAAKHVGDEAANAGSNAEAGITILDEAAGGLGSQLRDVGGAFKTLGGNAVTAFKSAVSGAGAMGKALIATGIGAIVVALGLVAAYWDDIVGAVSGVSSDQKKLLADTEATAQANQEALDAISASENSLKLSGKSEKEIRDLKIQQTNETIAAMEAQLTLQKEQTEAQVKALQRNKDIAQNVIRFLMAPVTLLLKGVDALTYGLAKIGVLEKGTKLEEQFSGGIAGLIFDPEGAKEEGNKAVGEIEKNIAKLKNQRDGYILQNKADAKKAKDDSVNTQKELNAEMERLRAENIADAEKKALALLEIERKNARAALVEKGASQALLLELDKNYEMQAQAIKDQFAAERKAKEEEEAQKAKEKAEKDAENAAIVQEALQQAKLDSMTNTYERAREELRIQQETDIAKLQAAGATEDQINQIKASYTEKNKKLDKEEADYKIQMEEMQKEAVLNTASQALGAIISIVGEGSAVGKAAAVAQTTIDTYQSATAAYKSVVGIPVVGPTLAPVAAGVAVVAGMLNVKKILSTKTPGSGGGAGGAGGAGIQPPQIPKYDPMAALNGAQAGQTQNSQVQLGEQTGTASPVIKAYVVASDVTNQQQADKKINDLARL
jgi:hypothetical protein